MQDIHTHLYWKSYDLDRDEVVLRARQAGVREMLVIGCTVEESKQAIATAEKYPDMYASVGLHPQEFFDESGILNLESWVRELRVLAKNEKVIAIGECGLEYYSHDSKRSISEEQKAAQKKAFLTQIALAEELDLPLIVHCRPSVGTQDAYDDLFEILKVQGSKLQAVLHCYMGDTEVTKQFLTLPNIYFSFTGNITYPVKKTVVGTKDDLTETVKLVPRDRLFVETDCPFLSPQAKRGERNEPTFVTYTGEKVQILNGLTTAELHRVLEENFSRVFGRAMKSATIGESNHYCTPMMGNGRFATAKKVGDERAVEKSEPDSGIMIHHAPDAAGKDLPLSSVGGSGADQFRIHEAVPTPAIEEETTEEGRPIKLSHEPFDPKD